MPSDLGGEVEAQASESPSFADCTVVPTAALDILVAHADSVAPARGGVIDWEEWGIATVNPFVEQSL
jgi:hypothetical protein